MCRGHVPSVFLSFLVVATTAGAQGLYLHVLEIDAPAGLPEVGEVWRVALTSSDAAAMLESLPPVLSPELVEDRVVISVAPDQVIGGEPEEAHRAASFVIDFDEAAVTELTRDLLSEHPEPTVDDLMRFTYKSIPDKILGRGWDLASRVAERGEGDCSEHAVLLTALARAVGYPARVVSGVAIVLGDGDEVQTFGHAWAEIHNGVHWVAADGTAIGDEAPTRLIPFAAMVDEGPGFKMFLLGRLLTSRPDRMELLPRVAGAPSQHPTRN